MKKKINPNRIPASAKDYDLKQMETDATQVMSLRVWAVFLAALSDFSETTVDLLLDFFSAVNKSKTTLSNFDNTEQRLSQIKEFFGNTLPLRKVNLSIRTQGDLNRLQNCMRNNAKAAMFALILDPIIREHMLDDESIKMVIKKIIDMLEEIEDGEISLQDIQDMLSDEYGLTLQLVNNQVRLKKIHETLDYS